MADGARPEKTPARPPAQGRPGRSVTGQRALARSRSELVGADDLAAADRPQGDPDGAVDGVLDEPHRAVAEQGVHPARMLAPGRGEREGERVDVLAGEAGL